jgi:FKBP-type peptidyl-prolyl cis-trans isomerase FklB
VFDSSWSGDYNLKTMVPVVLSPSNCVDGFATALQNMHIGDRWQVTIPYQLGYGTSDYSSSGSTVMIPGYSNLIFDITLVAYYRAGAEIPSWKAKGQRGVESTSSTGYWVTE